MLRQAHEAENKRDGLLVQLEPNITCTTCSNVVAACPITKMGGTQ